MKQISDQILAGRMLETREKGYSLGWFLRKNAARYFLLFISFGCALVVFYYTQFWMQFFFMLGMLIGCLLRDVGYFRATRRTWPFILKVTDWDKVEHLTEENRPA